MNQYSIDPILLDTFINHMLTFPHAHLSPSHKELTLRCPFCGDSNSNKSKTSFSINVDSSSDHFLAYQCFRASCGVRGFVNTDFCNLVDYRDPQLLKSINEYYSSIAVKVGGIYRSIKSKSLVNISSIQCARNDEKIAYINNRLGTKFSYVDLERFKINLDFYNLLKYNGIDIPESKDYYYRKLNDYGICFLSAYNDYAIIRDVSEDKKLKKRYNNINIFDNYEGVTKSYCIPTQLDLLNDKPFRIVIAEGVFDILGIYENIYHEEAKDNTLFIAACGSGIVNTIKSFMRRYGMINVKISIYSDADVEIDRYKELYKLKPLVDKFDITIYYNTLEKDYGVTPDRINLIKSTL